MNVTSTIRPCSFTATSAPGTQRPSSRKATRKDAHTFQQCTALDSPQVHVSRRWEGAGEPGENLEGTWGEPT